MTDNEEKAVHKNILIKKMSDLEGKFLLVRVGSTEQPASDAQIEDIQNKLQKFLEDNNVHCLAFVTHHAVEMDIIESSGGDHGRAVCI